MITNLRIFFLSNDSALIAESVRYFAQMGHQVIPYGNPSGFLGQIYADPPDVVIADASFTLAELRMIFDELKRDSFYYSIPIIVLLQRREGDIPDWEHLAVDDFLYHPFQFSELLYRITLSLQRFEKIFDSNPLTKLPGNSSIQNAIRKSLGKPLAVCYIDINNFKSYNDTYGFARGDEVIRILARIVSNIVKSQSINGFVGHIGGDDFVFIVNLEHAETASKTIIEHFEIFVSDLFEVDDYSKGYYIAKDRLGNEQQFPLLSIAIAIVPVDAPYLKHYGKVAAVAAELKKYAKTSSGSRYVINRRKS